MGDAEFVFKSDVSEKKRIGNSAFTKKGGRGSRKCSLPSDYLTKKQLKERNGKVVSIKLNEPMSWNDFRHLSHDLQLEYIRNLKSKYEARNCDIANMFGIDPKCFSAHIAAHLPEIKQNHRGGGTRVMSDKWAAFMNAPSEEPIADFVDDIFPEDSLPSEAENEAPAETSSVKQDDTGVVLRNGSLFFEGFPYDVFVEAVKVLGNQKKYHINLFFYESKI